jgi:branched-chain amino acid transport system permease protein
MSFAANIIVVVMLFFACGAGSAFLQKRLNLTSIAHGAVFGTGAYVYAVAATASGSALMGAMAALIASGLAGSAVVLAAGRVVGDDYALTSFALQVVWLGLIANIRPIIGGVLGIPNIPSLIGTKHGNPVLYFAAIGVVVAIFMAWILRRIARSAFALSAAVVARSSELADTLGISSFATRAQVGIAYGVILGLSGVVFGSFLTYIDPTLFSTDTSITILAIGFFGVVGGIRGTSLGAIIIVGIPELMRFLGSSMAQAGFAQMAFSGIALAAIAVWSLRSSRNPWAETK